MARLLIVEDNQELASLIASYASSRGYTPFTFHTGEGALKAIQVQPCRVAIVDLLLPDMRGGNLLSKLREHKIPAIAVSGVYKGSRFSTEAMSVHGAVAFFEKPFDMRTLFDAVDQAAGVPAATEPTRSEADGEEDLEELAPLDEGAGRDEDEDTGLAGDGGEDEPLFASQAPASQAPAPAPLPKPEPQPPAAEGARPAAAVPFAERDKVWTQPAEPPPPPVAVRKRPVAPAWSEAGDLSTTSLPKLLTAYYQARHSGELKLRQGNVVKVVGFENGRPIYAASNVAQERFARFCVRKGVISESALPKIAALVSQGLRTSEAMIRLLLITAEQRKAVLEDLVRQIIWSTFTWTGGQFRFVASHPRRADLVKLSLFPGDLIMEGVQRTFPLIALRQKLPGSRRIFPCSDPPYPLHELKLTDPQARLLAQADGTKTVEDLLALADLPEREALATLLGFELWGLVVQRTDDSRRQRISFGL